MYYYWDLPERRSGGSMTKYAVQVATPEHGEYVARHIRVEDAEECVASFMQPAEAIQYSLENSHMAWTWTVDEVPAAIGGIMIISVLSSDACPWLLTTPMVEDHKIAFARMTKRFYEAVKFGLDLNINACIDSRYLRAIEWAKWLGLKINGPQPIGKDGANFNMVN